MTVPDSYQAALQPSAESNNSVARGIHLPRTIYHITDISNWPFIEQHGLLSTQALLDMAGVAGAERERLNCQQRIEQVILPNQTMIGHQRPMPPAALERCLVDMTPAQWYALLNSKVFFWLDSERLNRMRKAARARPKIVMQIDTERLLVRHAERVTLAPINTGNARRQPARRGQHSFVPYITWIETGWSSEASVLGTRPRPRSQQPAELTVAYAVRDVMDFVVDIRRLAAEELF